MTILVTGAAGFIGFHVCRKLLDRGDVVVGLDNLNNYYDPTLKQSRLDILLGRQAFSFHKVDLADQEAMAAMFSAVSPRRVIHLAAQAGVRYSIEAPMVYAASNLMGFSTILEGCRQVECEHLAYASTSSVYGLDQLMPFTEHRGANHPLTFYAATKRANELMAHSYAHLYGLPCTGLRFFTVYGPWGRPDMALFKFTKAIMDGRPIDLYNGGDMVRDFTYVDDIVEGVVRLLDRAPTGGDRDFDPSNPDPARSEAPWRVYNIGNGQPVPLMRYVEAIEDSLGMKAEYNMLPMQPGDVPATHADTSDLARTLDFAPATPISEGVARFVEWYREHYRDRVAPDAP